jgi:hypothetical protein
MPELAPVRKTFFTMLKMVAWRDALRVATELIPILTIVSMQESPSRKYRYRGAHAKAVGFSDANLV